jgi:hypothetical protein
MRLIITFVFLLCHVYIIGQEDFTWWNKAQKWDGATSWTQYLKYSSKYLGPNALPVPDNISGRAGDSTIIELNSSYHYYSGDQTKDVGYYCNFNLIRDFISLQIYGMLAEKYSIDTITRDIRASRKQITSGTSMGDVNMATIIQLAKEKKLLDLALRINLKTASGQKMDEARATDGPAYYFDLSAGKNIYKSVGILRNVRLKSYLGFYCWQTMLTQQRQSDAYMYSLGVDFIFKNNFRLMNELSGYNGSLKTGDRPLIFKSTLHYSLKNGGVYFEYFSGLHDYLYQSFRVGFQYKITTPLYSVSIK